MSNLPFQTLETLQAYQFAREFRKLMYAVARRLPDIERFGLASQVRRASGSLTNNIAEGHGRHHFRDQSHFLVQARGSLEELIDDLNVCEGEKYLSAEEVLRLKSEDATVQRVINGYGRYLRDQLQSSSSLRETSPRYKAMSALEAEDESWIFD
jgi:four helix bundle protein